METFSPFEDHYDARLEHLHKMSVFNQCMAFVDAGLLTVPEAKLTCERVLQGESMFPDLLAGVIAAESLRTVCGPR